MKFQRECDWKTYFKTCDAKQKNHSTCKNIQISQNHGWQHQLPKKFVKTRQMSQKQKSFVQKTIQNVDADQKHSGKKQF